MRLAIDEDFNERIVRGLALRLPDLDLIRIREVGMMGDDDEIVLEWAARENRILLTHDVSTMPGEAKQRVESGLALPGVILVPKLLPIGAVIQSLFFFVQCSLEDEWDNQVRYLPIVE